MFHCDSVFLAGQKSLRDPCPLEALKPEVSERGFRLGITTDVMLLHVNVTGGELQACRCISQSITSSSSHSLHCTGRYADTSDQCNIQVPLLLDELQRSPNKDS